MWGRKTALSGAGERAIAGAHGALAVALCAALLLAGAPSAGAARAKRRPIAALTPVSVSVDQARPGPVVPREFLGLSFEAAALPQLAGDGGVGDLVTMLRSLGPGVLRFGGVTADERIGWTDALDGRPSWAAESLEAGDLLGLGALAANSRWHVLLTLGFGHFEPETAAREAAAAKATLGEWLQAIEIGNEPNTYAVHDLRAEPWTPVQYDEQLAVYRSAIEAAAPGIPLAGPDVSGSSAFEKWGPPEVVNQRPALLTGHHYPLGCVQVPAPSITRLLSPEIRKLEGISLGRYMAVSEAVGTPFRLDETNTVSCGGLPHISDTFASALWAVGYLTQAMQMGVSGINLEGNPTYCEGYTPVCAPTAEDLASGTLQAQPEWYALLLAKALIGDRPLPTSTSSPRHPNVQASAFVAPNGALHIVVVDDDPPGSHSLALALRLGRRFRDAGILSLTAPSPAAISGVRLGGLAVAPNGSWSPPATRH